MKNYSKLLVFIFIILMCNITYAQKDFSKDLNKQSLEEFGIKKDSIKKNFNLPKAEQPVIGNNQQDLNKQSLEQFKNINTKQKNTTNADSLQKINAEQIKKNYADSILKIKQKHIEDSIKNIRIKQVADSIKNLKTSIKEEKIPEPPKPPKKPESAKIINTEPIAKQPEKQKNDVVIEAPKKSEFSNEPIVQPVQKPSKPTVVETQPTIKPKINYDSLKNKPIKEFYIETQPLVTQNGKVVAVEEAKQAEVKKPSETVYKYSEKEIAEKQKKASYNQYQREADSIRNKNKLLLDSLLATLNVDVPVQVGVNDYIEIYVSGGGLFGGINPKEYDRTMIFNNGLIQREYKSKIGGIEKYEKKVSREDLIKLAQFIVDLGYFNFYEEYECDSDDVACKQRMKQAPTPIPLNISVAIGVRREKIDIDFYAPSIEKNWVKYPENLVKILNAIYAISEK
jgi:hypothetical protein